MPRAHEADMDKIRQDAQRYRKLKANATLCAEAPGLLAAAKNLLEALSTPYVSGECAQRLDRAKALLEVAVHHAEGKCQGLEEKH